MQTCASLSDLTAAGKPVDNAGRDAQYPLLRVALAATDTEVWQAQLDPGAAMVLRCAQLLSEDERLRAQRFHAEKDRRRYIVARGMLRILLGNHLKVPAATIDFDYTKYGKPYVTGCTTPMHFNVSHSEERALYAVSTSCCVGVDVEYLKRDVDYAGLAKRFFSAGEHRELQQLPASSRQQAFFSCWTRKEAVVKALGVGLSLPLDRFEVTARPNIVPRVLRFASGTHAVGDWKLYSINVGSGYHATLAEYRRDSAKERLSQRAAAASKNSHTKE